MAASAIPDPVAGAIEIWLRHHDRIAPGVVEGLYLVGSVALGDWREGSDIDIVATTADAATPDVVEQLEAAHLAAAEELGERYPTFVVDGPRLAWGDLAAPPISLMRAWTLDGHFHFDGECFEINPVTWYTLAEYGVAVRGPDPVELDVPTSADERRTWVRENVDTYWRSVGNEVAAAASDDERDEFSGDVVEWCVLGPCRMLYTYVTGDVASKSGAGRWMVEQHPRHRDVVELAIELRDTRRPVGRAAVVGAAELIDFVVDAV